MEYELVKGHSGYCYDGNIRISLNEYNDLSESERDFILSDILEHEHIHKILHKLFNYNIANKFDNISHLLDNKNNTKFQKIAHRNYVTTWQDVIQGRKLLNIKRNRKA